MAHFFLFLVLLWIFVAYADWDEEFDHKVYADELEEYKIYWTIVDASDMIEIGLEVESNGWIGFGLSPNGQMPQSDIIMGWIDDNDETYLQNRYTSTSRNTPIFASDITDTLISSERINGTLRLRFIREIFPCSTQENDENHNVRQIEIGTTQIIYAWNDNIPDCTTTKECEPLYHQTERGSVYINFLTGETPEIEMPEDIQTYDIVQSNYTIPTADTTYYCKLLKFPSLSQLHHIIRVDPYITKGNVGIVHHIVLYRCSSFNPDHLGIGDICDDFNELDLNGTVCVDVMMEWAIGRKSFYYPEHVGQELGGTAFDALEYVKINIHYDNPNGIADISDSSGLRFFYTPTLRENAAMIMLVGYMPYYSIFLPGGIEENFIYYGYCASNCTSEAYTADGIHVIANAFHTHTQGVAGKLRHVRNGIELEPIDINNAYNNDYQDFSMLKEEITILPGDELIVECHYNTKDNIMPVYGGQPTWEEMCHTWMIVYPKNDLTRCSAETPQSITDDFFDGATEMGWWNGTSWNDRNGFYNTTTNDAIEYYWEYLTQPHRQSSCHISSFNEMITTPESRHGFVPFPESNLGDCTDDKGEDDMELWLIIVIVGAAVIILFALLIFVIYLCRKNKNKNVQKFPAYQHMDENEQMTTDKNESANEMQKGSYGATTHV